MMLFWIIAFSLIGGILSMAGGVVLSFYEAFARKFAFIFISFAAGVLLGFTFLELIPTALDELPSIEMVAGLILGAIIVFFVMERFLWWYSYHRFNSKKSLKVNNEEKRQTGISKSQIPLLLAGDTVHNFVDGVLIAAAFLVDFNMGVAVTAAVLAHELPQEIADFGVMLSTGVKKKRVFITNFITSLATPLGGIVAFFSLQLVEGATPYIFAATAGVFLYVALTDLLPAIHHQSEHKYDPLQFFLIGCGILFTFLL